MSAIGRFQRVATGKKRQTAVDDSTISLQGCHRGFHLGAMAMLVTYGSRLARDAPNVQKGCHREHIHIFS